MTGLPPLSELRVLEISSGTAPAYAAKLLGDVGADVVKLEPPEGDSQRRWGPFPGDVPDPLKSGYFIALNLNKRSVQAPLTRSDRLSELLDWADILVHGINRKMAQDLGLDAESLHTTHPNLVTLCLTPFGVTGPYADYTATELTLANAGGWANLSPATHTDPDLPPLKVTGEQCLLMSGIAGATTALAVWRHASSCGLGEFIDFSMQEYVASVLEVGIPAYSYKEEVAARYHERGLIPWRIFQAKDGPVFIVCIEQDQWERLVDFMGNPEWASLDTFVDQLARKENQDLVHMFVQEFVSEWNAHDLYHAAQKHRICVAPVMDLPEIAVNDHLLARHFFETVPQEELGEITVFGSSVLGTKGRAPVRKPAPRPGEHDNDDYPRRENRAAGVVSEKPLAGVRVLDMTWAWAGPFCSLNLAHLGAEVIRLESELRPDLYRRLPVFPVGVEEGVNQSGMFNQWNQGKSSVAINLGCDAGVDLVKALVREADVVVQNFATRVMDRMGLGYEVLKQINPRIILASISGYGQQGPYAEYMGYGPAIPPLTGLSAGTGYIGGAADEIGLSMPDPTSGITAAYAVAAALIRREETGEGDHLDVSLWEATGVLNIEAWMDYTLNGRGSERLGNRSAHMSPHGVFACEGEDAWISIACVDDEAWQRLADLIGVSDTRFNTLVQRKASEDDLEAAISGWTRDKDRWQLTQMLQAIGVTAMPTFSTADVVNDPHLNKRGFIERLQHPEVGVRAHTGIPWRLNNRPNGVDGPAPCLGADTDQHLKTILGLSAAEIEDLYAEGVIGC